MNKSKGIKIFLLLIVVLLLSACNIFNKDNNKLKEGKEIAQQSKVAIENTRDLFGKLVNIESYNSNEGRQVLNDVLENPEQYLKSLEDNNTELDYGRYKEVKIEYEDEKILPQGDGKYEYSSFAKFEMFIEGEEKSTVGTAFVDLVVVNKGDNWKIVSVNISQK